MTRCRSILTVLLYHTTSQTSMPGSTGSPQAVRQAHHRRFGRLTTGGSTGLRLGYAGLSPFFAPCRFQLLKAPSRGVSDGTTRAKAAPGRGSERIKAVRTLASRNCEK